MPLIRSNWIGPPGASRASLVVRYVDVTAEQVLLGFEDLTAGVDPHRVVELRPGLAVDLGRLLDRRSGRVDPSPMMTGSITS